MYYENGDIYEGEWMKDKNHGKGIIRYGKEKNSLFLKSKIDHNVEKGWALKIWLCV